MEGETSRIRRLEDEDHVMNSTPDQKSGLGVSEPEGGGERDDKETYF